MKKHKHHIIPRHAGGSNDMSNIVELTPEEHATAHRILYEKYNKWQDYLAWKGLSGRLSKEEIIREKARLANTGRTPWHKGKKIGPRTLATKQKISSTMKARGIRPSKTTIEKAVEAAKAVNTGRAVDIDTRKRISDTLKEFNKDNPRPFIPRSSESKLKTSISMSKKCSYKNITYNSLNECKRDNSTTRHHIIKDPSFYWI